MKRPFDTDSESWPSLPIATKGSQPRHGRWEGSLPIEGNGDWKLPISIIPAGNDCQRTAKARSVLLSLRNKPAKTSNRSIINVVIDHLNEVQLITECLTVYMARKSNADALFIFCPFRIPK